uniref:Calcium uniporter protein n=1 Tax=Cacopsylla melanoneura TaxID=428564 RepID=A0A8D8PYW9_9HEMI
MFARLTVFRLRSFSIVNFHCVSVCRVSDFSKENNAIRKSPALESPQPSLSVGTNRGRIRQKSSLAEGKLESQQIASIVKLPSDTVKVRQIQSCECLSDDKFDRANHASLNEGFPDSNRIKSNEETDHKLGPWRGQSKKDESKGIENSMKLRNTFKTESSSPIQSLFNDKNILDITNVKFAVNNTEDKLTKEDLERFSHIRHLVRQLNEALNVEQQHDRQEKELQKQLETIKTKLEPLENQKQSLELNAGRHTNLAKWVGLGLMGMQFGILARLTWWEYSWDIMEPVTYFVTFGTAMGVYAYHAVIKHPSQKEYLDRVFLNEIYKRAKTGGFPLDEYNGLKNECARLEHDLKRLRNPLNLAYKGKEE